jgi:hypothetical protein
MTSVLGPLDGFKRSTTVQLDVVLSEEGHVMSPKKRNVSVSPVPGDSSGY